MSEEEKKAIEDIKKDDEYLNILEDIKRNKYNMCNVAKLMKDTINGNYTEYEIAESIVYFVKLLEKQQKEIEELKQITLLYNSYEVPSDERKILIADSEYFAKGYFEEHFISKDKIRSLLRQVNASLYHFKDSDKNNIMQRVKDRLKELLEE